MQKMSKMTILVMFCYFQGLFQDFFLESKEELSKFDSCSLLPKSVSRALKW